MTQQFDEREYLARLEAHYEGSSGSFAEKMDSFPRFVPRQIQSTYLYRWELYKEILGVHGSIAELGVWLGFGVFSFATFATILEPFNHTRRVIGFDTFEGFPSVADEDLRTADHAPETHVGGFGVSDSVYDELQEAVSIFDSNRPIPGIDKIHLVKGDVRDSIPRFLEEQPHTLLALLYIDVDLYEPTKAGIDLLYDRVVPGGIVAFDELNYSRYPGETIAYLEQLSDRGGELKRFPFEPIRSYFVKR